MRPAFQGSRNLAIARDRRELPSEARVERCVRWPAGQLPHVFIDVRKRRLDPCSPAVRRRVPGRVRSYDFCRWMLPRARPWTSRTSRTTGSVVGTAAASDRSRLRSSATAEGTQGQGPRKPTLDALHRDCSRWRLRPDPDRFGPPPVADTARFPVRIRPGKKTMPPPPRTLAGHAQRKGRAAPDLREEIRRSPARGAFRRRAARFRERSCALRSGLWRATRQRLFHHRERPREGCSLGTPGLGRRQGRYNPLSSIDRSAPDDFCVRGEVRMTACPRLHQLAPGQPPLLTARSPGATGLASSLSGCVSSIGQR
jgi:hypothetical protein